MNWSYVAGLFDGEGSVSIYQIRNSHSLGVVATLAITCNEPNLIKRVKEFLECRGIRCYVTSSKNPLGYSCKIVINNNEGLEIMINNLLPLVVSKRHQLKIVNHYLLFKKELKGKRELIVNHLDEFDVMRHQLHGLAVKGPIILKAWEVHKV